MGVNPHSQPAFSNEEASTGTYSGIPYQTMNGGIAFPPYYQGYPVNSPMPGYQPVSAYQPGGVYQPTAIQQPIPGYQIVGTQQFPLNYQPIPTQGNIPQEVPINQKPNQGFVPNYLMSNQLMTQVQPQNPVGNQEPATTDGNQSEGLQDIDTPTEVISKENQTDSYIPQVPYGVVVDSGMNMGAFNVPPVNPVMGAYDKNNTFNAAEGFTQDVSKELKEEPFDYSYISSPARIAIYDNLQSAPRVIQIPGSATHEYIERIAALTYQNAQSLGGTIPYTVIREVSENFIHANFSEVIVSIFDNGNTIRFTDQGPGIHHKELAQQPGFTSASEPMKRYIRGVGSGLPIVKDYLNFSHGHIKIEDNVGQGAVVTISLIQTLDDSIELPAIEVPSLTENEQVILKALLPNKTLGVTEMNKETGLAPASIHSAFKKMEDKGYIETINKKRTLTKEGHHVAQMI